MEPLQNQLAEEKPSATKDEAMIEVVTPPGVETLRRQRIQFDRFFTGPTW